MSSVPPGFDGVYRCKNHPDREPNPISGKLCAECHENAINAYVDALVKVDQLEHYEGGAHSAELERGEWFPEGKVRPRRPRINER